MIDIIYADKKDKYFKSDGTQEYDFKEKKEPETFAELQELCKIYIGDKLKINNDDCIFIRQGSNTIYIDICGDIIIEPLCYIIAEKRTPVQLWNFIKSIM